MSWAERERDFWDHHVPSLEEALQVYGWAIDDQVRALLELLGPLEGKRVLDFACGAGVLSALAAARGAQVVGVDVSPVSIARAKEVAAALDLDIDFRLAVLDEPPCPPGETFDLLLGRFALHHLDLDRYLPVLAATLEPGGTAAFIETMATNPLLRFARSHLVGRFGVKRLGTLDEHPLTRADIDHIAREIGPVEIQVPYMELARLVSRQAITGNRFVDRVTNAIDDWLGRFPRLGWLSYHQVLIARKPIAAPDQR